MFSWRLKKNVNFGESKSWLDKWILTIYLFVTVIVSFLSLYDQYSFQVIPVMGQVIAGDWKSYQYLVESIRQFPDQVSSWNLTEKVSVDF